MFKIRNMFQNRNIMPSILSKIALGYLSLTIGLGAFVLVASADLRFVENQVREGVTVSSFRDKTQEMRRHEKNYFLYRSNWELDQTRILAEQLAQMIERDRNVLIAVDRETEIATLAQTLEHYNRLISQANALDEAAIRAVGQGVSAYSDLLVAREKAVQAETLRKSRYALFWAVLAVIVLALGGGYILYRAVGRPLRQLEEQLAPLAAGRFHAFSMVSQDREIVSFTTALNRMLAELEHHQRQALQSDKLAALGTLASGVAHELNNPLGNISGACQILVEELERLDTLPDEVRADLQEWLTQIDDETERAQRIVRTLLDYSRKPVHEGIPVLLVEIVEKSLLLLRQRLPAPDSVRLDIPANLMICNDPQRLQQVFINLIQNAIEAGGAQTRITISACTASLEDWPPAGTDLELGEPQGPRAVLISIFDNGPGIAADRLPHIFEPFYTTRAPGEGTGLGLYIVGEIVQEQGGAIAVTCPATGGTRFSLWLPCDGGHTT
jgi:signal transduction histidine kinase